MAHNMYIITHKYYVKKYIYKDTPTVSIRQYNIKSFVAACVLLYHDMRCDVITSLVNQLLMDKLTKQ